MGVLENPFFIREVRAYSRRAWNPLSWFVLSGALGPLFALWLEQRYGSGLDASGAVWFRGLLLATVAGIHALLCGFAGWQLGSRVFGSEHRRHTLQGLRLISTSPWIWVLLKLVFPLYVLLLVWIAILPGCLALIFRGAFLPLSLLPGLILAGCAGLLTFCSALIVPPERIGLPRANEQALPLAERLELGAIRLVPAWISWLMLRIAFAWLLAAAQNQPVRMTAQSRLATLWLRDDHALALLLGAYGALALSSAWAWANPSSPLAARLRGGLQLFAIGTAYLSLVGLTWAGSHWVWKLILIGVPAVQFVRLWQDRRRARKARCKKKIREDQRSQWEVSALQRRWDNPVLVRDLRVALRGNALLWLFLKQWLVIGLIGVVMGAIISSTMGGPARYTREVYAATMVSILGWIAFVTVMRFGNRASVQWAGERRMNTVSQLLLSPITGREVIYGRWSASLLEGATIALPWLLGFGFFLLLGESGVELGMVFAFTTWILSLGLLLSVAMAAALQPIKRWCDCFSAHGAALGLFIGEPLMFIWGLGASPSADSGTASGMAVILTLLNLLLVPPLLWGASRDVETYRNRSLD